MRTTKRAFTLIEVLVVVAIIALLVAILLPSLSRSRALARMVQCQTSMRQIGMGFATYSAENKHRLPGQRGDAHADWLGGSNVNKVDPSQPPRQPEDGTIWKHMGKDKWVFVCPDDKRENLAGKWYYSYTSNLLLSGAKVEMLSGAHHPLDLFDNDNHSTATGRRMKPFDGVPLLIEEDIDYWLTSSNDSGWCNDDCVTDRHLKSGRIGYANMAYADTHVGRVQLPPRRIGTPTSKYFAAATMCIRTIGNKWVSGKSWDARSNMYGYLDNAESASAAGVIH